MKGGVIMTKRFVAVLSAFVLAIALLPLGSAMAAAVRYPDLRGAVTDDANALSKEVAADIASFQSSAQAKTGVKVYVAVVHFLDGVDAQTYANTLFSRWGLSDNDFLLLGAAGEDAFASAAGTAVKTKLTDSNTQGLLFTSGFSEAFKAQEYDAAFSRYFVAFADMLNKQYNASLSLGKLFADYQPQTKTAPRAASRPQVAATISDTWKLINENIDETVREYDEYHKRRAREKTGISSGSWIVLILLFLLIFRRRKYRGRAYQRRKYASKNGCSPIGWIFGIFGLGMLFGKKRK